MKLTEDALASRFNHFKIKVGQNQEDDLYHGKLIHLIV